MFSLATYIQENIPHPDRNSNLVLYLNFSGIIGELNDYRKEHDVNIMLPTAKHILESYIHFNYKSPRSGNRHRAVAIFFVQQIVHHKLESYFFSCFYS